MRTSRWSACVAGVLTGLVWCSLQTAAWAQSGPREYSWSFLPLSAAPDPRATAITAGQEHLIIPVGLSPEDVELGRQLQSLLGQFQQQQDTQERQQTQQRLAEVLSRQFDRRQEQRKQQLEELQVRVQKLQELFDKRQAAKAQIIQHRLDTLLRDVDGLGWGEETGLEMSMSGLIDFNSPRVYPVGAPTFAPAPAPAGAGVVPGTPAP